MSAGKIHHAALSNFPAWRVSRAVTLADLKNWAPIVGVQHERAGRAAQRVRHPQRHPARGFNWRARLEQPTAKAFVNAAGGAAEYFR
ncbi:hypothetical protein [Streptomyces seoulensis]|uniref:hypothetical protein n=1 Tax=Streptomyces seoulensis TaxID=73044 RepID=UPI001FCC1580|nr:hypothetical protein [Streptomyces seoulensis]BDH07117.1 hypothetical protein HEK131_43440 [Streptomyces seoulensis]